MVSTALRVPRDWESERSISFLQTFDTHEFFHSRLACGNCPRTTLGRLKRRLEATGLADRVPQRKVRIGQRNVEFESHAIITGIRVQHREYGSLLGAATRAVLGLDR